MFFAISRGSSWLGTQEACRRLDHEALEHEALG